MNTIKFNTRLIGLCVFFFVVSIKAADKADLKNNKKINSNNQNSALAAEAVPEGYVEPAQLAKGIKLATPARRSNKAAFSAHKETGVSANKNLLSQRADDSTIERIIDKHLQGQSLTPYEEQVLRNNINELPYLGDGTFRPSLTERSSVFRNASDLFFSEYSEGSGNNKYLEIYNGTGQSVDLSNYLIRYSQNGAQAWESNELGLSGALSAGDVYVVAHSSANASILAEADTVESAISAFNGDDVRGLFKIANNDTSLLDIIGTQTGGDPGSGWDVAGITNATKDHTLVRKSSVSTGNTNWSTSAGTTTDNSEWTVYDLETWSYLGSHTMVLPSLLSEGFESGSIPENWSLLNPDGGSSWYAYESSFYAHSGSYLARVYYNATGSDDWLITPKLDVASGDSISFWARSSNTNPYESFNVRVSSTSAEAITSFTDTLANVSTVPTAWTRYAYALEPYAGQDIYIAVQHNTVNGWYLYVDDFSGPQVWIDNSPVAMLSKSSINYGNTGLGGMTESVVIENLGASDLVVSSVASSNSDFSVSASSLTLMGGGVDSETINITYTPSAVGADTSYVVFTHNGSTSPDSVMVMGAGKDAVYWQDFESWAAELGLGVPQPIGMTQEGNMSVSADGESNGWEKATGTGVAYEGEYSAEFDSYESSVDGDTSAFILPAIEYTTTNIAAVEGALRFYMKKRGTEEFYVSYSTDSGSSWTKAFSDTTENYSTGNLGWVSVSINVPLGATYIFKMVGKGNRQSVLGDIYVDQLTFEEVPPTPELSLTYSSIGYMPQLLGETTENTRFSVGTNTGSAALVIDSIAVANSDFSISLSAEISNSTIAPGSELDLDMIWSPSSFGLRKTNAIIYHNADTSPDTIAFSGEAGRSYVSFDDNDNAQGAAFSGSLPWQWKSIDHDGDGYSWLFNYSYYGPGYTGSPLGFYARSIGGGERLETRTLVPQSGDSLIFYYNSSNAADSGFMHIQVNIVGSNAGFVNMDSVQLSGYSNQRAAMSLAHYSGDTIVIALQDDQTYNTYNYHRVDDMLLSAYEIASTSVFVLESNVLALSTPPTVGTPPTTPATESLQLANMGSAAMTVSSIVSDNSVFVATLANSTIESEEETELTVTFSPSTGGTQTGHIVLLHDGPSSPDTLHVTGDGGPATYITGVVSSASGVLLDSATVMVSGSGGTTYTSAAGEYGYYGSPQGLTGISFEKEGYHNAFFNVNLLENDTVTLDVTLQSLDVNGLYSSGFEATEDSGSSEVTTGTNAFGVSSLFVTTDQDTVLPKSGSAMLVFPDSGAYENNDMVFWVSDSTFDLTAASGRLTFSLDVNIDTEEGFDFFYFCLRLDDGIAWYTADVGLLSGATDGWQHLDIDMSWVLDGRSETATPCILFSADGGEVASGGAFDNLSVAWDPFFLAAPSELTATNYGTSIPLSWEPPEESGRATYTIRSINLSGEELPSRPEVMGDDGVMVEVLKGEREFVSSTVLYDYTNQPSRSFVGYNLFKRDWPFGLWELEASVSNNAYEDAAVADGQYYEYAVSAVYDEGESFWIGYVSARAGTPVVVTDDVFGVEDFESNTFSWENWDVFYSSDAATWVVGDSADASTAFGSGALSAPEHTTFAYISDGRANDENFATWLVSPFIDFMDNFTAIVRMSGYAQVYGDFANNNVVQLLVRSDMGPWQVAVDFGYDHVEGWKDYSASVGDLVSGRDKAQFALLYTHTGELSSGNGNGVAFDDLYIETIPGPHSLTSSATISSVSLSWLHPDSSMFTRLVQETPSAVFGDAVKTDVTINNNNRELTCFNPVLSTAYYWGFGEGFGVWTITEFDADTVPLLSASATYFNTANTMNSELQTEVLVAIIDSTDNNVGAMDTLFHSYETIETDDILGVKVHSVALSDTFFNQPDQAVFVMFRALTEAVWEIAGSDTTFFYSPFFMSDDGASWSGQSGMADTSGNFFVQGGGGFGMEDWADFSIDLCADVPPPDIAYNVYKNGTMVVEEIEENIWTDEYVSASTEACYQVHGVVPRYLNIGSEVLYVMHETDPTNEECASAMNAAPGAFSLTTPPDGHVSIIRPENIDGNQLFAWSLSADPNGQPVTYSISWTATVNGTTVSIDQDTSGRAVFVPLDDIYSVLQENGIEDTLGFRWNVVSSDGQLMTASSNGPRYVIFDIGYMLSSHEELGVPDVFALHQNYPNPFNPVTTIRYDVPEQSNVRVDIYNVLGRKVAELVNKTHQPGFYSVSWDGTNTMGSALGSGMYFYRIDTESFTAVKKLILVK